MLKYLVPVGLFAVLVGFLYFGLNRDKETLPSPLIGKTAPLFELPRLDDPSQTFSNREFAGKPYVLNVWGSWCVGCRQEHDALLQIARRGEVPIVGLNWNDDRDTRCVGCSSWAIRMWSTLLTVKDASPSIGACMARRKHSLIDAERQDHQKARRGRSPWRSGSRSSCRC